MISLLAAILFSLAGQASDSGQWAGKGSCHLSHAPQIQSYCEYLLWITRTETDLHIRRCTMWRQEWGEGWECPETTYQIRNGSELWIEDGSEQIRAGEIADNKILVDFAHKNGTYFELYQFKGPELLYEAQFTASGMEWRYGARMQRSGGN